VGIAPHIARLRAVVGHELLLLPSVALLPTDEAGSLLLVKETGTRFIYVGNELHPVLNWASALMLTGGNATITTVSASSLAGIPHRKGGVQAAMDYMVSAHAGPARAAAE